MSIEVPDKDANTSTTLDKPATVARPPLTTPALRKRARRMSGTRRFAVGMAVWGMGVTLFAGIQTARIGTLEDELQDLPQTMAALESRVASRTVAIEKRQQELQALLNRYDLIMEEDPRAPELLERKVLLDRRDELEAEGQIPPSGGPFDADADADSALTPVIRSQYPTPTPRPKSNKADSDLISLGASVLGLFRGDDTAKTRAMMAAPAPVISQHPAATPVATVSSHWNSDVTPAHARNWTEVKVGSLADDISSVSDMQNFLIDGMVARLDETIERRSTILSKTGADLSDILADAGVTRANGKDGDVVPGVGGPYIPADLETTSNDGRDFYLLERLNALAALNDVLTMLPIRRPVAEERAYISSHYGRRRDPIRKRYALHAGLDLAGRGGTPIMATAEGTVVRAERAGPYGNLVEIDHGNGLRTRFGHLRHIDVIEGEAVAVGQKIGRMGSTGRSTGTHLHYEIWVDGGHVDPLPFIEVGGEVARESERDS
ncbi:MAG: peptidoglycan DD-metalloendopeptidase family protein [Alphaproteobacteria bacterium]